MPAATSCLTAAMRALGCGVPGSLRRHTSSSSVPMDRFAENPAVSAEIRERWRAAYGLDRPLAVQFFDWMARAAIGDFGQSFFFKDSVANLIAKQFDLAFHVDGFWSALLGALIITVVSFLINIVLPDRYEG